MSKKILNTIKKLIGPTAVKYTAPIYHGSRGVIKSRMLSNPSSKLNIIGITGTKGKTSTSMLTARLLNKAGLKTGFLTTASICEDGINEYQNPYKMTSIDSSIMQQKLANMVNNKCSWVVIELSSEGLKQNRHLGLSKIDIGVFLNLYPEHIESHGSLQNYINAKGKLFKKLKKDGVFIGNGYQRFVNDKLVDNQLEKTEIMFSKVKNKTAKKIILTPGLDYKIIENNEFKNVKFGDLEIETELLADFEARNLVFSLEILKNADKIAFSKFVNSSSLSQNIKDITSIPGRMDWVIVNGEVR